MRPAYASRRIGCGRKRGRGFGLDIIYRTMSAVVYHPGTNVGNITVLEWDPLKLEQQDEVPNA